MNIGMDTKTKIGTATATDQHLEATVLSTFNQTWTDFYRPRFRRRQYGLHVRSYQSRREEIRRNPRGDQGVEDDSESERESVPECGEECPCSTEVEFEFEDVLKRDREDAVGIKQQQEKKKYKAGNRDRQRHYGYHLQRIKLKIDTVILSFGNHTTSWNNPLDILLEPKQDEEIKLDLDEDVGLGLNLNGVGKKNRRDRMKKLRGQAVAVAKSHSHSHSHSQAKAREGHETTTTSLMFNGREQQQDDPLSKTALVSVSYITINASTQPADAGSAPAPSFQTLPPPPPPHHMSNSTLSYTYTYTYMSAPSICTTTKSTNNNSTIHGGSSIVSSACSAPAPSSSAPLPALTSAPLVPAPVPPSSAPASAASRISSFLSSQIGFLTGNPALVAGAVKPARSVTVSGQQEQHQTAQPPTRTQTTMRLRRELFYPVIRATGATRDDDDIEIDTENDENEDDDEQESHARALSFPLSRSLSTSSSTSKQSERTERRHNMKHREESEEERMVRLIQPPPPYTFCVPLNQSMWVKEEHVLQFAPTFPTFPPILSLQSARSTSSFDYAHFSSLYERGHAWDSPIQDPDIDIILVETLRRLKGTLTLGSSNRNQGERKYDEGKQRMFEEMIDETKVLPQRCEEVYGWKEERDLPPFPGISNSQMRNLGERSGEDTQEDRSKDDDKDQEDEDEEQARLDQNELFCPHASCRAFACNLHIRDGRCFIWPVVPPLAIAQGAQGVGAVVAGTTTNTTMATSVRANDGDVDMVVTSLLMTTPGRKNLNQPRLNLSGGVNDSRASVSRSNRVAGKAYGANTANGEGHQISTRTGAGKRKAKKMLSIPAPIFHTDHMQMAPVDLCLHSGPCDHTLSDCACAKAGIWCERNCLCSAECPRRFPGCRCKLSKNHRTPPANTTCGTDSCACWVAGRECDPEVCGSCGTSNLGLIPNSSISCTNLTLQQSALDPNIFPHTRVGISKIAGYGLFSSPSIAIPRNTTILEYLGELIDDLESEKRVLLYEAWGGNYLCGLNLVWSVDAFRRSGVGGGRYVNCSEERAERQGGKRQANCEMKSKIVAGSHRLVLVAKYDIKPNEELLFDYGKSFGLDLFTAGKASRIGKNTDKGKKTNTARKLTAPTSTARKVTASGSNSTSIVTSISTTSTSTPANASSSKKASVIATARKSGNATTRGMQTQLLHDPRDNVLLRTRPQRTLKRKQFDRV